MSNPIRLDISTVREVLGDDCTVIDLNGDRVLSAGDLTVNAHDPLEKISPQVVGQNDPDGFFAIATPDNLLKLLEKGGKRVQFITGETGGRVFLVTSQKNDATRIGAIYEIGDYTKINDTYRDGDKDDKIDLNISVTQAGRSVDFDYDRLQRSCVSKNDPSLLKKTCLDDLKEYEQDSGELQVDARAAEAAYTRLILAYEQKTLSRHEIEDYRQELKTFRDALTAYQKTRETFEQKYQKTVTRKGIRKKTEKQVTQNPEDSLPKR